MTAFEKFFIKLIPKRIKIALGQNAVKTFRKKQKFGQISFGQEGEDILIDRLLQGKKEGFYVDVGAHHPRRFSNTRYFYDKGWKGINIDAMPGSMTLFEKERPKDINLEVGVSKTEGELVYYIFNEPALNTFSKTEADKKDGLNTYKIVETQKVFTYPLQNLLKKHLPEKTHIDFMTIDVEGLDLEVVASNDWEMYRPSLILVESLERYSITELPVKSEMYQTLRQNDYELVAKTMNTLFFKDQRT
jgi:FkbM family methyltransferase